MLLAPQSFSDHQERLLKHYHQTILTTYPIMTLTNIGQPGQAPTRCTLVHTFSGEANYECDNTYAEIILIAAELRA